MEQVEVLSCIQTLLGQPEGLLNKARLFYSNIKKEGQVQATKVIHILVKFSQEMQDILKDMYRIFIVVKTLEPTKGRELGESSGQSGIKTAEHTSTPGEEKPLGGKEVTHSP